MFPLSQIKLNRIENPAKTKALLVIDKAKKNNTIIKFGVTIIFGEHTIKKKLIGSNKEMSLNGKRTRCKHQNYGSITYPKSTFRCIHAENYLEFIT